MLIEQPLMQGKRSIQNPISDFQEEMHFRVSTFPVDGEMKFPHFQFNEGLHLEERELLELETFLRKLMSGMAHFFFKIAQENPEM